jgi:hypothetical protein
MKLGGVAASREIAAGNGFEDWRRSPETPLRNGGSCKETASKRPFILFFSGAASHWAHRLRHLSNLHRVVSNPLLHRAAEKQNEQSDGLTKL